VIVIDSARRLVACCHQDLLVEQVERRPRGSESSFPSRDVHQSQIPGSLTAVLLDRINPILRGWTSYFKHGASKATFAYLGAFTWHRVLIWLRHKHKRVSWKWLRNRYLPG